jgi:hypothetical protein
MRQTTIQVPACAVESLHRYRAAHGLSRDGAVRQLLVAHVNRQLEVPERDRLTHVSTIMRHPLRPIHPSAGPDPRVQLSMRLPEEVMSAAKDVGLVLPGQSPHGGNADYRARPLTDSIMTAIAAVEPMTDDLLGGLRPCIRHKAAVGLWRLAVAATMTSEEQRVLLEARDGGDDALRRVVEILRAKDSAWHDQLRTRAVRFLVRRFLTEGSDEEEMLYDQRDELELQGDGLTWAEIRADFEEFGLTDERFDGFERWSLDLDGRGAANVWRVRRKVELEGLSRWLSVVGSPGPLTRDIEVPGWQLRVPDRWTAVPVENPRVAAPGVRALIESGQVLLLRTANPERGFLWPLAPDEAGVPRPVRGLDTVVAAIETNWAHGRGGAAVTMPPAAIAEVLLLDNSANTDDAPVDIPVFIAHRAGLVSEQERDQIIAAARADTRERMARFAAALRPQITDEHLRELKAAMDDEARFFQVARRKGLQPAMVDHLRTVVTKPVFRLEVVSLAQEVADGLAEPALTWLTNYVLGRYRAALRDDRMQDWQRGMDNNRHRPRFAGTDSRSRRCDTQT